MMYYPPVNLMAFIIAVAICALFSGCATPRTVIEHHHHHYEADTLAVRAQVDRHLTSWHEEMQSVVSVAVSQQLTQQQQSEHQKEVISELITVSTDSVGRTLRQEQRTISRAMVNSQWSMVNSITSEYEARLRMAVDSLDGIYQQRYDSLAAHFSQMDSTLSINHQPSAIDHRPWYRRWFDAIEWLAIGVLVAAVLWFTRRLWWPLVKRLIFHV